MKESYLHVVAEELRFRKISLLHQEVLDDTIEACFVIANRKPNDEEFKHLHRGIINITNFIIDRFKIEEAIVAGGKIAYLCLVLKSKEEIAIEKYHCASSI